MTRKSDLFDTDLEELTITELQDILRELRDLHGKMAGNLYPRIIESRMQKLIPVLDRKIKERHKDEEV